MPALIIFASVILIIAAEEIVRRTPKKKGISGGLDWRIKKGVLTLSGKGPMENFSSGNRAPWGVRIREIVIGEGVTTIGENAFAGCERLVSVTIPENVSRIESHAFAYCDNLSEVIIETAKEKIKIGSGVFPENCSVVYKAH
ncbi:MAG: leucine-rich repeat domain-containing protein [Ruminococcaceae bacterium]|nr:leucine-rich repeat domain-containing protein [Oscillospiraceae bacterium]